MHKALEDFLLEVGAGGPVEIVPSTWIKDPYDESKLLPLAKPVMVPAQFAQRLFRSAFGMDQAAGQPMGTFDVTDISLCERFVAAKAAAATSLGTAPGL